MSVLRASTQLRHLLRLQGVCSMSTASSETVEVCFVDPRTILQRTGLKDLLGAKQYTALTVPQSLLPALSQGAMELGELDDPMCTWHFGAKDELFKYRMMGTHPTMSGFTSILAKEQLVFLCEPGGDIGLPDWEDFKADLLAGSISWPSLRVPFLFAGSVLDAPAAAVYQLKSDGQVVGLAVSSEAAEH